MDSLSLGGGAGPSVNTSHNVTDDEDTEVATDCGLNNVWGGIPAKNKKGENLLLFIGIIDILQSYRMLKKMEHFWKSLIHDGDTVSVHRPGFYAKRFQEFLFERVFRKQTVPDSTVRKSFRRGGHLRRTLSKDQDQVLEQYSSPNTAEINRKESTITVIKIGENSGLNSNNANEVNLPYVLRDKVQRQNSKSVVVVGADVQDSQEVLEEQNERGDTHTPLLRNAERPFACKSK